MKVLLIHQFFKTPESGGPLRSYYLAKALVEAGINTIVITSYNGEGVRKEIVEGVEVHYLPILYDNSFGFIKRIRSYLSFVWSIVREAGQFKDTTLCYAISTPLTTGIAARWIKKRYGISYVFEVGDLWPEAPIQLGVIRNAFLKWFLRRLERRIYQGAEVIVALSESIRDAILKTAPGRIVHIIPNIADTEYFHPVKKDSGLEDKYQTQGKFVVSYIGTFGFANGLEQLLDCARESQVRNLPVRFLLCGEGAMQRDLEMRRAREELSNVMMIPFQNRDGVREVLNVTDAAFISFRKESVLETGSPNKYFDALAAGKLIIANFGGWLKEEIERTECGFAIGNALEFCEKIQGYIEDPERLKNSSCHARKLAEVKYSRKLLSKKFVSIFLSDQDQ